MARVKYFDGFTPFLQFTEIYITSFWSGGFTTANAMNQKDKNLGKSIFVHFDIKYLATLTVIFLFCQLDISNLNYTGKKSSSNLGKKSSSNLGKKSSSNLENKSSWIFQIGELEKSSADR
jgi:hypothetical protein